MQEFQVLSDHSIQMQIFQLVVNTDIVRDIPEIVIRITEMVQKAASEGLNKPSFIHFCKTPNNREDDGSAE
jgi:hypothetical protein